jgi:hypothetical protein
MARRGNFLCYLLVAIGPQIRLGVLFIDASPWYKVISSMVTKMNSFKALELWCVGPTSDWIGELLICKLPIEYIFNVITSEMWCNACRRIQIPRCVHFLSPHHTLPPHPPTHTHTQLFIMSSRTNKTLEQLCNHLVSHEAHPDSGHLTKSILMLWLLVLVGPITLSSFNHCDLFELCSLVILVLVR